MRYRDVLLAAISYAVVTLGVVAAAEDDIVETPLRPGDVNLNHDAARMRGRLLFRGAVINPQPGAIRVVQVDAGQRVLVAAHDANQSNHIDRLVFGMDPKTARSMFEDQIDRKVREISNRYDLSPSKRQKLILLARADMFHLLHDAENLRRRYEHAKDDSNQVLAIEREAAALRQRQHDLLGAQSFFAKSANGLLANESIAARYAALDQAQYRRHLSNVETSIRPLERAVELRPAQRDRLIDLLLKESNPPRAFGDFDDTVLKYRLATMPEQKLSMILDHDQWPAVRRVLDGFLEFRPGLLKRGLIEAAPDAPGPLILNDSADAVSPSNRSED